VSRLAVRSAVPAPASLVVLYRSTGPDRFPRRPAGFDKLTCLRSFLLALLPVRERARVVFLNDGPVPEDRAALMRRFGAVVELPGLGNSPSFRRALEEALALPDETVAYFAEDDYLYLEPAFTRLLAVFDTVPAADYVTLFDHRDRYTRDDDARGGLSRIVVAGGQHWRTVESTCMTFGARVRRLRADRWIVTLATTTKRRPKDRVMWRLLQGQHLFAWKFPKRVLLGPVPSLATHMDTEGLAPLVDWEQAARHAAGAVLD
jgi:hypothetical protein